MVDSAHALAAELAELLEHKQLTASVDRSGRLDVIVTDMPSKFAEVASRFLGRDVASLNVTAVDL